MTKFTVNIPENIVGGGGGSPDVDEGGPGGGVSISDIVLVVYFAGRMHFIYLFPGFLNNIYIMDWKKSHCLFKVFN